MALWGANVANSTSAPIYAPMQVKQAANASNRDALYQNSTAGAYITGTTTGIYGVTVGEAQANNSGITHPGWVLRTVGSGGRAGRVFTETLVAAKTYLGDANDDAIFPDFRILIDTNPVNGTGSASNNDIVTFNVIAHTVPPSQAVGYQWNYSNGTSLTHAGAFSNTATSTLSVTANTGANGTFYVLVSNADAINATSSNATLTITA